MTMLAEVVDAVIGIDTHRDSHEVEIADAAGKPVAAMRVGNDSAGFAQLLAAIAEVAPGPRVAVCIEGTRGYGIGLARALAAAGLLVIECEQPSRKQRRGKGKSDPIDAHLAVLAALRLDTARLPVPRADGDREALRILLVARQEITVAATAQANRLRALLLAGDDADRRAARASLSRTALAALAGRELPAHAGRDHAVRQAEIARLALALGQARRQLKDNRHQLLDIVEDIAPGLTSRYGIGPVSAAQAIVSFSHPAAAAAKPRSPRSAAPARSQPAAARPSGTGSTAAATAPSTAPSTPSRSPGSAAAPHPRLCRQAHRSGKDSAGNPPVPQAIHRPRALPPAHPVDEPSGESLTNIEASKVGCLAAPGALPAQMSHADGRALMVDMRLSECSMIKPLIDLGGEAIQLLTAALGRLLLGVDEPNPQTRCPGIPDLPPVPLSASLELVTGDEVGRLGNRGGFIRVGPHGRGQAHDGGLGLGDDTVPVMYDERIAARPSNVLCLPVTVAYTHPPWCRGQSFSHAPGSVINPLGPGDEVKVLPVLIKVGPQSPPGMVPSRPRRRGRQIGDRRWGGCRSDQASEEGREGGRSRFGGQGTATRHLHLGRDRHTVNPRRHGQRFRTWETHASQRSLDLQTADDPSLEGTRFHHCPVTARQLDSDDVGKVSGAEEHPLDRRTQVTQTPVR